MFRGTGITDAVVVPVLLLVAIFTTSTFAVLRCEDARMRCAYRTGCGKALQQYLSTCSSVLRGTVGGCPETCLHALIALTSTDEGKELMTCNCNRDDHLCILSRERVEVCRPSVAIAMNNTRVSCRIATRICNADTLCSTALDFYNINCNRMFHGKKCTHRCLNSINILRRQEKAAKLDTCVCDGAEDYDCKGIHRNMNWLCFGKVYHEYHESKKISDDNRGNAILRSDANGRSTGIAVLVGRTTMTLTSTLLLTLLAR